MNVDPRGRSFPRTRTEHHDSDRDHDDCKKEKKPLSVERLAERRAAECADDAEEGKRDRIAPTHVPSAPMAREVRKGTDGDRERSRADRDVRRTHADDVEQKGGRENRTAAADQTEREADEAAGRNRECRGQRVGTLATCFFGRTSRMRWSTMPISMAATKT